MNCIRHDYAYLPLLNELVHKQRKTELRDDRTGVGTTSLFGRQMRFNLAHGFPLLTSKKVNMKNIVSELIWFISGDTNIKYLLEQGNPIWTDWRYKEYLKWYNYNYTDNLPLKQDEFERMIISSDDFAKQWGDIGLGYGHQWRNFGEVRNTGEHFFNDCQEQDEVLISGKDQLSWVINEIKTNPTSRRLIVSGWNPHEVDKVDLPPCHTLFQFFVEDGKLSCQLYQRSADIFLGVPFNIASYALLTHMVAQVCGLGVGDFIWTGGDIHLYSNHVEQAKIQVSNVPFASPTLVLNPRESIFDFVPEDVVIKDYESHAFLKAPVAV